MGTTQSYIVGGYCFQPPATATCCLLAAINTIGNTSSPKDKNPLYKFVVGDLKEEKNYMEEGSDKDKALEALIELFEDPQLRSHTIKKTVRCSDIRPAFEILAPQVYGYKHKMGDNSDWTIPGISMAFLLGDQSLHYKDMYTHSVDLGIATLSYHNYFLTSLHRDIPGPYLPPMLVKTLMKEPTARALILLDVKHCVSLVRLNPTGKITDTSSFFYIDTIGTVEKFNYDYWNIKSILKDKLVSLSILSTEPIDKLL